jgi:polyvinyl alcohol dehydrogenase (cytochrome)
MSAPSTQSWNGWSSTPANTRFQTGEIAGLTVAELSRLELKWAFGFQGDITAFAAATILDGTLFVGSAGGSVHAINTRTGCLHWVYQANGPVRSAMVAVGDGSGRTLVFGDQIGWFYALDARSGKLRWKQRVEEHEAARLTGTPAVHDGVVFVPAASWEETRAIDSQYPCCTFRGSVTALRVRDGSRVWKTYMVEPPRKTGVTSAGTDTFGPSGAGIWSTPTVDVRRGVLYITTGDNYSHPATTTSDAVVALHLRTGRIVWSQQTTPNDVYNSSCGRQGTNCPPNSGPDHDYGASAMLVRTVAGRDVLVAGQKSGVVYALDPDQNGKILWQTRVGNGGTNGGVQWGMASDRRNVYAAVSDIVRLAGGGANAAPLGDATFDGMRGGGLTALRLENGEKLWFAPGRPCDPPRPGCSPAQPGAVTAIPGAVFSGSLDGHLRAFSTEDGRILWDVDTVKSYATVNGAQGKGGSLDGAGAVIVGGMVFVNSGYPRFGGMPGNVLLAFGVEGQAGEAAR